MVFKSTDEGQSWEVVSPDLTKNEIKKHGPGGGPYTNEAAGGENYNTITYLVESPHEKGVLWAGSDDGLLHITQDGGQNWANVTPLNIPDGIINSIEISLHDPATAYVVVMRYKSMDLSSHIFKTNNYGQSWSKIVNGITGEHTFTRVVRADHKREGLLYAGTETGLFISLNDGQNWHPFQLNLPIVPINDLAIQDNDLVAATAGRSFWILDDLGAIQNMDAPKAPVKIFQPKDTYLIFGGSSEKPRSGLGDNPKSGVTIDYYLDKLADSTDLFLEIFKDNKLIRSYSNEKPKDFKTWPGGPAKPVVLPSEKGYNRFTWNFHKEDLPAIEKVFVLGGLSGSTVGPGEYTLKLTLDKLTSVTNVKILPNPNIKADSKAYDAQQKMLDAIENSLRNMHQSVNEMRSAKGQLQSYKELLRDNDAAKALTEKGDALLKRITSWEENLIQPKQKTFQDVINYNNKLNAQMINLRGYIDVADPKITKGATERWADLQKDWQVYENERAAIVEDEMSAYNKMYADLGLPAIILSKQ